MTKEFNLKEKRNRMIEIMYKFIRFDNEGVPHFDSGSYKKWIDKHSGGL